ncbi:MAG: hypothetical protein IJG33_09995, partial [Selenomonadaceae bacterium]|nr:hypothetical protein [Selenomonadaceae bacterium]
MILGVDLLCLFHSFISIHAPIAGATASLEERLIFKLRFVPTAKIILLCLFHFIVALCGRLVIG